MIRVPFLARKTLGVRTARRCNFASSSSSSSMVEETKLAPPAPFWMEPIHVLGAGSIGLLMAASLRVAFPSYPIRLLLREHYYHRITQQQQQEQHQHQRPSSDIPVDDDRRPDVLVNLIRNRRLRTVQVPSQIISHSFRPRKKFKNILLATKAYQAVEALDSIRHCLQLEDDGEETVAWRTQIVLLCNGAMAARDDILAHFPELDASNLHTALTTHGAYREVVDVDPTNETANIFSSPDDEDESTAMADSSVLMMDVVHAGVGRLDFPPALSAWTPLFDRAGLQAQTLTDQEMQAQLWCKLAANCLINPLTAIHQCTNGDVVQCPEWEEYLQDIPNEVESVAKHCQFGNDDAPIMDAPMLRDFCLQVVEATRDNRSSMHQDVKAGRRTEIDALNGYIVRLGQEHDIPVPANEKLYDRIIQMSKG